MFTRRVLCALVAAALTPVAALGQWSDSFDGYAPGSISGQGGWKGWDGIPGLAGVVSTAVSRSAPAAQRIDSAADSVRTYGGITSGAWSYTLHQYIPAAFTGSTYVILLNTYNDLGPYDWSVQLNFDSVSGVVIDDLRAGSAVPFVRGAWARIRIDFDLSANTISQYYNDQLIASGTWTTGAPSVLNLAAVDLFGNTGSAVYYDDMSLTAAGPGSWDEGPVDAGETLATARVVDTPGAGTLARISGSLGAGDVDLYKIHVCDPAGFSATTVGGASFDTRLYLFRASGVGIAFNDDSAGGLQSTLTSAFTAALPAGDYYLGVSTKGREPRDIAGTRLWNPMPATTERGPDGAGAANGAWAWAGSGGASGAYTVQLTGVQLDACEVVQAVAFGVIHESEGGAILRKRADGAIEVSPAIPGSEYGVAFRYGGVECGTPGFFADPASMPLGTTMSDALYGSVNGVPGVQLSRLQATMGPAGMLATADFSGIGGSGYSVAATLGGDLMGSVTCTSGCVTYAAAAKCRKEDPNGKGQKCPRWFRTLEMISNIVNFPEPVMVSLAGGEPVLADALSVCPAGNHAPVSIGEIEEEIVRVTGPASFDVVAGGVFRFMVGHTGLGESVLTGGDGGLSIAGIGSSGQDGIRTTFGTVDTFDVGLDLPGMATAPTNSFLRAEAFGAINGVLGRSLGTISLRKTGAGGAGAVENTVDFSAISSPTHRLVVLSGGVTIADLPGRTGPAGTSSRWPRGIGKLGGQTECFVGRYELGTQFSIGGTVYTGDELRVLAEGGAPVDFKSELALTAVGPSGFGITSIATTPVSTCLADLNGDGLVDFSDYLEFLNLYDAGDLRVDFNGDGLVDFSDYLEFLNLYDAGC